MRRSLLDTIKVGHEKDAIKLLLHGCYTDLDAQSERLDGTALYWSCCRGFSELVQLLLLQGADVNACTSWGASSLHAGVDKNRGEIIELLLRFGAGVNQQTTNGDTPCHLAAYRGFEQCVQPLCRYGADIQIRNKKGRTPIQESYSQGHHTVYRYLCAILPLVRRSVSCDDSSTDDSYNVQNVQLSRSSSMPRNYTGVSSYPSSYSTSNMSSYTGSSLSSDQSSNLSSYPDSNQSRNGSDTFNSSSLTCRSSVSGDSDIYASKPRPPVVPERTIFKAEVPPMTPPRCELDDGYTSDDDNSSINDLSSLLSSTSILTRSPLTFRNI